MKQFISKIMLRVICFLIIGKEDRKRWNIYHEYHDGDGAGKMPVDNKKLLEWILFEDKNFEREWYEISNKG